MKYFPVCVYVRTYICSYTDYKTTLVYCMYVHYTHTYTVVDVML